MVYRERSKTASMVVGRTMTITQPTSSTGPPPSCTSPQVRPNTRTSSPPTLHTISLCLLISANEGSGPFTWKDTAALGTISLAMVPNSLPQTEITKARQHITAAADVFVANEAASGYGTPYKAGTKGYAWGSNSFVLNEMMIMGLAYDFSFNNSTPSTGNVKYLNGIISGLDYLMGRNAMDKSYVTGYGANPVQNPHHRHWAHQAWPIDKYPPPPPGAISGGPNSSYAALADPLVGNKATIAMDLYAKCNTTPMKCYVDDVDAWATNEITINWNAPFLWVLNYVSAHHPGPFSNRREVLRCTLSGRVGRSMTRAQGMDVTRTNNLDWLTGLEAWFSPALRPVSSVKAANGEFTADVTITNISDQPINGWELIWTFPGDQQIYEMWNAGYSQSGITVTVWDTMDLNKVIPPNGGTVTFGFNGTYSGENAIPTDFTTASDSDPNPGSTPIPGPGTGLPVNVVVNNDWGGGYCTIVTITNNTDKPVDWEVTFNAQGTIYDFWNTVWAQSGSQVTAGGVGWNNILQPGESTHDVGFCANK